MVYGDNQREHKRKPCSSIAKTSTTRHVRKMLMENKPATIQNDTVRVTTNKYMEGAG